MNCKLCLTHDDGAGTVTRVSLCYNSVGVIKSLLDLIDKSDLSGNATLLADVQAWILDNSATLPSGATIVKRDCDIDFQYESYELCLADSNGDLVAKVKITEKQDSESFDVVDITKATVVESVDQVNLPEGEIFKSNLNQVTYVSGSTDDGNLVLDINGQTGLTQAPCLGCADCDTVTSGARFAIISGSAGSVDISNGSNFKTGNAFTNPPNTTVYTIDTVTDNEDGTETVTYTPTDTLTGEIVQTDPPTPEFSNSIIVDNATVPNGSTFDIVYRIENIGTGDNVGQIVYVITPLGTSVATTNPINPTATTANVGGGITVNNSDWDFVVSGSQQFAQLKPGVTLSPGSTSLIVMTATMTGTPSSTGTTTSLIQTGSGGDVDTGNNFASQSFTIS